MFHSSACLYCSKPQFCRDRPSGESLPFLWKPNKPLQELQGLCTLTELQIRAQETGTHWFFEHLQSQHPFLHRPTNFSPNFHNLGRPQAFSSEGAVSCLAQTHVCCSQFHPPGQHWCSLPWTLWVGYQLPAPKLQGSDSTGSCSGTGFSHTTLFSFFSKELHPIPFLPSCCSFPFLFQSLFHNPEKISATQTWGWTRRSRPTSRSPFAHISSRNKIHRYLYWIGRPGCIKIFKIISSAEIYLVQRPHKSPEV